MINWLVSYPKSGNTWVRFFLTAYITGRLDINEPTVTEYDLNSYLYKSLAPFDLNHNTSIYLRHAVLLHLIAAKKRNPLIVKSHWANIIAGGVMAFPKPLIKSAVYLVRDPRDVCQSFAKHLNKTVDLTICEMANPFNVTVNKDTGACAWLKTWSEHVESWKDATVIKYEDLISDPEQGFSEVLKTYGIKRKTKKIKKSIKLTDLERLKAQEKKSGFVELGKQETFFGGPKDELTDKQIRRIEEDHGEVMKRYDYGIR